MLNTPIVRDLVLIGGGHSHVHVIRSFGMQPVAGVRLTIVSRDIDTPYSGMLPGYVAGFYSHDDCHIDLRPLARFANARLLNAEATGIDRANKRVLLNGRPSIAYDVLSIDVGSTPRISTLLGADKFGTPVKPISRLAQRWQQMVQRVTAAREPLSIVVVGGGAAGVELILAARHRLRGIRAAQGGNPDDLHFRLLTRGEVLAGQNQTARRKFREILREQAIALKEGCEVASVDETNIRATDGQTFSYDELLWVTEAGAAPWIADTGLDVDAKGFIAIDACLQSTNTPDIFAAGDCATSMVHPRPKAGVFAVRQGPPLTENLRRSLAGQALKPFRPQKQFLCIISAGDRDAVAARGSFAVRGKHIWTWKDHIDRTWMAKAKHVPDRRMQPLLQSDRTLEADAMRCGGCGAKVGASSLARVIERLKPKVSESAAIALDGRDDAAVVTAPAGKLLIQTVDFFRSFIDDPYLFGRIAATHALGDVFAMGGTPLTALATAVVPHAHPRKVEEDLFQILRGGLDVLEAEGCALVGGHSAEGSELALGFTINGAVDPGRILRKGGMRAGDVLILTKPLGTGALLAAEMRGKAKAAWIDAALATMQVSNQAAATILMASGAHAATDVTGFGLAGHLDEMVRASGVSVKVTLSCVPILAGATEVSRLGIASSLAPDNAAILPSIANSDRFAGDSRLALLIDPQTAGGLLGAVPEANACECLEKLNLAGYCSAAIIGRVVGESGGGIALA